MTFDDDNKLGRTYLMVHFNPVTGALKQWGFGHAFFEVPDCDCAELPEGTDIHKITDRHRVDVTALERSRDGRPPRCKLIEDKTQ